MLSLVAALHTVLTWLLLLLLLQGAVHISHALLLHTNNVSCGSETFCKRGSDFVTFIVVP